MSIKRGLKFFIFILLIIQINVYALNKAVVDITKMDISDISRALELKLITSEELIKLYLDRINEYDKNYNSIITINEKALEDAKRLDQERSSGKVRSVLHGIPIVVKDNIDVEGMPTTAGAKALKDNYPKQNAFVVQKLIDAGAIILAKTNMSEFAFYASSSISSYGTVNNAFNTDYSSYGSSGGSAVALAVSFSAAALGTDTNSSVRLPAAANNLIGLRPTVGLLSRTGVLPYDVERDTVGTITKTLNDAIILMNIMNGYDETDYKSINQSVQEYKNNKKTLEGIVLGVPTKFLTGSNSNGLPENKATYTEVKQLMDEALAKMVEAGAQIVYIDDYYTFTTDDWYNSAVSGYTFCDGFNQYIQGTTGRIRSFTGLSNASDKITYLGGYVSSCGSGYSMPNKDAIKDKYQNYVNDIMTKDSIDVFVYPSSKNKLLKNNNTAGIQNLSSHASSTINYPAITMPLGFDSDGLAYGIEFMVPTGSEQILFDIASSYESLNKTQETPKIAPALYTISEEVNTLLENYQSVINIKINYNFEQKWLDSVVEYFRVYSNNENAEQDAYVLNSKFKTNKLTAILISTILYIIKWFLIIVGSLLGLLLVRKMIRRKVKKFRRAIKSRKYNQR